VLFVELLCRYNLAAVQSVVDIPIALAATNLAAALSYYIALQPRAGYAYHELYESPYWAQRCPGPDGKTWEDVGLDSDGGLEELHVSHFSGTLIALVIVIAVAWTFKESQWAINTVVHSTSKAKAKIVSSRGSDDIAAAEYFHQAIAQLQITAGEESLNAQVYQEKLQYYATAIETIESKILGRCTSKEDIAPASTPTEVSASPITYA